MTRGDMRSMLERQLQDTGNAVWSTANLNTYLNLGLNFMQTAILQVDPEAYFEVSRTNMISTGSYPDLYPFPQGMQRVTKVELQYSTDDTYSQAFKRRNDQIDQFVLGNTETTQNHWAKKGRWLRIYPTPVAASTNGIRLTFVPTLTMGADADVPDLLLTLHKGIVYAARIDALGDTDEDTDAATLDAVSKKLAVILDRIPLYFGQDHSEPEQMEVGIDHEEGWT